MLRDLSTIQKSTPLSGKKSPDFWNAQGNRLGCLNPHEPTGRWHSKAGGTCPGPTELGKCCWWSPAYGSLGGNWNQGISVTLGAFDRLLQNSSNEIFQSVLNPGFTFTWTFSSQPVAALGFAQPAACRMPCNRAEELLAITVPYMPTADAIKGCSFPLEMPVAFARQPTL